MTIDPQLPVVGEDIPGPAVPCHVGTARGLEMVNQRTRTLGVLFAGLILIRTIRITTCYMRKNMTVQYDWSS